MKVLILNTGSSSVKYRVFEFTNGDCSGRDLARGMIERIGLASANIKCDCIFDHEDNCVATCAQISESFSVPDHASAIRLICKILKSSVCGVLDDLSEIVGIGHRVVHGAEEFKESILINDEVLAGIERCCKLAPLHNPPALMGIRACHDVFPGTPQVAVFDTAFHATIPPVAYMYPMPLSFYREHGVRKYGFHGTSHRYVTERALELLDKPAAQTRIITCHLGNGSSITAVRGGKSIDTSMGLTPLAGVMMGTRPGNLDPYIPLFMQQELRMRVDEVDNALNKESGLKGICGRSDMRDIEERAAQGDKDCILALDMFAYRVAEFIGKYAMVLGGMDAIVFTAGIGERGSNMRKRILENTAFLGIKLDEAKNTANELEISASDSRAKIFVIPTNEELVIARDTARLVGETALAK